MRAKQIVRVLNAAGIDAAVTGDLTTIPQNCQWHCGKYAALTIVVDESLVNLSLCTECGEMYIRSARITNQQAEREPSRMNQED